MGVRLPASNGYAILPPRTCSFVAYTAISLTTMLFGALVLLTACCFSICAEIVNFLLKLLLIEV